MISDEAKRVLSDLNPWWGDPPRIRPEPPAYLRRSIRELVERLRKPRGLIEVIRGPRQVGKTTAIYQAIQQLIHGGLEGRDILFIRFDLELLRREPHVLRETFRWYADEVRRRPADEGQPPRVFLDEIHKLPDWSEEVKHLFDTFAPRMMLTGSSSVLVAQGGRESLAGRTFTTELPPFSFREVLEAWWPHVARPLPPRIRFLDAFEGRLREFAQAYQGLKPQQKLAIHRHLERYFARGGYPRLHSGEVEDDRWADYLVETVFENVLGADIPTLFPVQNPELLRSLYLWIARHTGQEISQGRLAEDLTAAGIPTNQPTVGKYLHYLADALLIREFRRYPLAKRVSARVPSKIALSDLGVRNAIFRDTPSLFESDPGRLGPLVETLVQACIRDHNLRVYYYRDFEDPKNRRSRVAEVDFVAERVDGTVLPIEVKFRKRIDPDDLFGVEQFQKRFEAPLSVVVTRDLYAWMERERVLFLPMDAFLLAF